MWPRPSLECRRASPPGPVTDRAREQLQKRGWNEESPALRGFLSCAREDSNLHLVSPDKALNPIQAVLILPEASKSSKLRGFQDALDALDGLDVVKLLSRRDRRRRQAAIPFRVDCGRIRSGMRRSPTSTLRRRSLGATVGRSGPPRVRWLDGLSCRGARAVWSYTGRWCAGRERGRAAAARRV